MLALLYVLALTFGVVADPADVSRVVAAARAHGLPPSHVATLCFVESTFGHPHAHPSRHWCGAMVNVGHAGQPAAAAASLRSALDACGTLDRALLRYCYGRCTGPDPRGYIRAFRGTLRRMALALARARAVGIADAAE